MRTPGGGVRLGHKLEVGESADMRAWVLLGRGNTGLRRENQAESKGGRKIFSLILLYFSKLILKYKFNQFEV